MIRFVRAPHQLASLDLRGGLLAHVLGVPCETGTLGEATSGDTVIFVKFGRYDLVSEAKARGCRVALDVVDLFCNRSEVEGDTITVLEENWYPLVDVLIVPNEIAARDLLDVFPKADYVVIPHQWDYRLEGKRCQMDRFRPGYIGAAFNMPQRPPGVELVTESERMIEATPAYNCHISYWETYQDLRWKPATKISNAAAVGANCVCSYSASAVQLLGEDYPFYVRTSLTETLAYAQRAFDGVAWHEGLQIMDRVRDQTSLARVASKYLVFEGDE